MAKKRSSRGSRRRDTQGGSGNALLTAFLLIYVVTGFPLPLRYVEVTAQSSTVFPGYNAESWQDDVVPMVTQDILNWGENNGVVRIHPDTLRGALKAAALERNTNTGKPQVGTGKRVDIFTILGMTDTETSLMVDTVNPETKNVTGGCIAYLQLMGHSLLDGPAEVLALKKIAKAWGLNWMKIYGSCGAGCIGWGQALPANWVRLMGTTFYPWNKEHSPEFTARYLVDDGDYFTRGRNAAIRSYNPEAADWEYLTPILTLANKLERSWNEAGLGQPQVELLNFEQVEQDAQRESTQDTPQQDSEQEPEQEEEQEGSRKTPVETELPTRKERIRLDGWPVPEGTRETGAAFGVPTIWQPTGHTGRDYGVSTGTPLTAVGPGIVEHADWWPTEAYWRLGNIGHGNCVILFHGYYQGQPVYTYYAHMSKFNVQVGDYVQKGDVIGLSGNTGAGSGPHFHFGVRVGGGIKRNGTDARGRKWADGRWEDPLHWVGHGKEAVNRKVDAEIPIGGSGRISVRVETRETRVVMADTLILRATLLYAESARILNEGTNALVGSIDLEERLGKDDYETFVRQVQKLNDKSMFLWSALSDWTVKGQPPKLGLDRRAWWLIVENHGSVSEPEPQTTER